MPYKFKFGLLVIFIIFIFLEWSELTRIGYSQDKVYSRDLNNTVLVGKSLNSMNEEDYLINEFDDISKIEEVSRKLKRKKIEESEDQDFEIKTKTRSGRNYIYVAALQSIANSRKIYPRSPAFSFNFNYRDPITGNLIRPTTMLEAHITCGD